MQREKAMSRRIAILLTSNDTSEFASHFPHDGVRFTNLLQPFAPDWQFETVSVKDNIFPESVDAYDGYVITGSPASVSRCAIRVRVPVVVLVRNTRGIPRSATAASAAAAPTIGRHDVTRTPSMSNSTPPIAIYRQ